jgi:hypothetical protein
MNRFASSVPWVIGTALGFCTACNAPGSGFAAPSPSASAAIVFAAASSAPRATTVTTGGLTAAMSTPAAANRAPATAIPGRLSPLQVKRFVVAAGVKDREPTTTSEALVADGSAIYAFAELANPLGDSENVRITFERSSGAERVGNVTLPVPGQVSRHRTWAMTRFIRAAGVWDAVLWSEGGAELARTSFEVGEAS